MLLQGGGAKLEVLEIANHEGGIAGVGVVDRSASGGCETHFRPEAGGALDGDQGHRAVAFSSSDRDEVVEQGLRYTTAGRGSLYGHIVHEQIAGACYWRCVHDPKRSRLVGWIGVGEAIRDYGGVVIESNEASGSPAIGFGAHHDLGFRLELVVDFVLDT